MYNFEQWLSKQNDFILSTVEMRVELLAKVKYPLGSIFCINWMAAGAPPRLPSLLLPEGNSSPEETNNCASGMPIATIEDLN